MGGKSTFGYTQLDQSLAVLACKMAFSTSFSKAPVAAGTRQAAQSGRVHAFAAPSQSACRKVSAVAPPSSFSGKSVVRAASAGLRKASSSRAALQTVAAIRDGATLDRPLRVAVIGGGPSGACAAETLAAGGVETFLIERKLDNCKVIYH